MLDQCGGELTSRQPDQELVAESVEHVVPTVGQRRHRKLSQIGVLLFEEATHQEGVDGDLRPGHRVAPVTGWHRS